MLDLEFFCFQNFFYQRRCLLILIYLLWLSFRISKVSFSLRFFRSNTFQPPLLSALSCDQCLFLIYLNVLGIDFVFQCTAGEGESVPSLYQTYPSINLYLIEHPKHIFDTKILIFRRYFEISTTLKLILKKFSIKNNMKHLSSSKSVCPPFCLAFITCFVLSTCQDQRSL